MKKYLFIISIIGLIVFVLYLGYLQGIKKYEERMDNNIINRNCSEDELVESLRNEYKCPYSDRRVLAMVKFYEHDGALNSNIFIALIQRDLSKTIPVIINELKGSTSQADIYNKEWLLSRTLRLTTITCNIDQKKGVQFWEKYYNNNRKYYVPVNKEGKVEYTPGLIDYWKIHAPSKILGITYKEYLDLDTDKRKKMLVSKSKSDSIGWQYTYEQYVKHILWLEIKRLYTEVGLDENQFLLKEKDMDTVVCPPLDEE